jgi:hypothetical protein
MRRRCSPHAGHGSRAPWIKSHNLRHTYPRSRMLPREDTEVLHAREIAQEGFQPIMQSTRARPARQRSEESGSGQRRSSSFLPCNLQGAHDVYLPLEDLLSGEVGAQVGGFAADAGDSASTRAMAASRSGVSVIAMTLSRSVVIATTSRRQAGVSWPDPLGCGWVRPLVAPGPPEDLSSPVKKLLESAEIPPIAQQSAPTMTLGFSHFTTCFCCGPASLLV